MKWQAQQVLASFLVAMLVIQEECDWTYTSVNTKDQQKTKEEIKSQKVPSCVQCKVVLLNIGNGVIHHLLHFRSHAGEGREGGRRKGRMMSLLTWKDM